VATLTIMVIIRIMVFFGELDYPVCQNCTTKTVLNLRTFAARTEQNVRQMNARNPPGIDLQPILENERTILHPLREEDFEPLYAVASDPKIWEQHPNRDRWKKDVFRSFFDGAMQSKGAFKVVDRATGTVIGSTRFYDYSERDGSIFIGYTFYAVRYWGTGINRSVKTLLLDHIFRSVSKVYFHVGAGNVRSQMAIGRIGAKKIGEREAGSGGASKLNFVYELDRKQWKHER